MPLDTIIKIPTNVVKLGISSKYNQPINDDHNNIEYSKGETTAGEAMLYAENKRRKASVAVIPVATINKILDSKSTNHSLKIN